MRAPRGLATPDGSAAPAESPQAVSPGELRRLAQCWSDQLAPPASGVALAPRLATVLRRLAAVVRAEPFDPRSARPVGAALAGVLNSAGGGTLLDAVDALAPSLRILRARAAAALGVSDTEGDGPERLVLALDELAAGFAEALAARRRPARALPRSLRRALALRHAPSQPSPVDPRFSVYEQAAVGVALLTLDGHLVSANPALTAFLDLGDTLAEPRPFTDYVHVDDLAEMVERYGRLLRADPDVQRMDVRLVRRDGAVVWARMFAALGRNADDEPSHVILVIEDEPARLWLPSAIGSVREQLARLPGASVTEEWLMRSAGDGIARVGICALDLDGFGALVDVHGAEVGDRILLAVAGRLGYAAGEHLVTRTGADEFTVLIADPEDVDAVVRVADRCQSALAVPFPMNGHDLVVAASIGVAEGPAVHACPKEVRRAADVARSWAKALGGGRRVVFDPDRDAGEASRYAMVAGIPRGIANGEFRLVYQPLVGLPDGRMRGVEALVRWQHPQEGLLGPDRFIEHAEQSGAIVPLGRWVLATACAQAARWCAELGLDAPFVSVNVSPVQLAEPSWVTDVIDVLRATGLPPSSLQLEITEQAVLGDGTAVTEGLSALRAAGVRLALDDFGTGWSSLAWLRRLPVHALKIDGSFVDGLRHVGPDTPDPAIDTAIIGALVNMAHVLGIEVTAEWVETGVQAERLAALACDLGQGFWFGEPGPGEWVPGLVRRTMGAIS